MDSAKSIAGLTATELRSPQSGSSRFPIVRSSVGPGIACVADGSRARREPPSQEAIVPERPGGGISSPLLSAQSYSAVGRRPVQTAGLPRSRGDAAVRRAREGDSSRGIAVTPSRDTARSHLRGRSRDDGGCGTGSLARYRLAPRPCEVALGRLCDSPGWRRPEYKSSRAETRPADARIWAIPAATAIQESACSTCETWGAS